mgnify:CR=1 FL=1
MSQERIPFWTAFRMWRTGAKGVNVEITFGLLILWAIQAVIQETIKFFTLMWVRRGWDKVKNRWRRVKEDKK